MGNTEWASREQTTIGILAKLTPDAMYSKDRFDEVAHNEVTDQRGETSLAPSGARSVQPRAGR